MRDRLPLKYRGPERRRSGFSAFAKRFAYKHAGALLVAALGSVSGFVVTAIYTLLLVAPRVSALEAGQASAARERSELRSDVIDIKEVVMWLAAPQCAELNEVEYPRSAAVCSKVGEATRQTFTPRPRGRGR